MAEAKVGMLVLGVVEPRHLRGLFLLRRWGRKRVDPGDRDYEAEIERWAVASVTFGKQTRYTTVGTRQMGMNKKKGNG